MRYQKKEWKKFINSDNASLCPDEAIDILSKMLIYDHADRITPKEAMEHPYFEPIRKWIIWKIIPNKINSDRSHIIINFMIVQQKKQHGNFSP